MVKIQETKAGRLYIKVKGKRVYLNTLLKRVNKKRLVCHLQPIKKITQKNIEKSLMFLLDPTKTKTKKPKKIPTKVKKGIKEIGKLQQRLQSTETALKVEKDKDKIEQLKKTLKETQEAEKEQRKLLKSIDKDIVSNIKLIEDTLPKDEVPEYKSLFPEVFEPPPTEAEIQRATEGIPDQPEDRKRQAPMTEFLFEGFGLKEYKERMKGMGIHEEIQEIHKNLVEAKDTKQRERIFLHEAKIITNVFNEFSDNYRDTTDGDIIPEDIYFLENMKEKILKLGDLVHNYFHEFDESFVNYVINFVKTSGRTIDRLIKAMRTNDRSEDIFIGQGIIQKAIDFTRQIFTGRDKLGATSQKRLDKFGDEYIKSVYITRKPIMKGIKVMANLLTNGKFEKDMLKHGFDDLFHLALNIELENGVCLTLQKNETVYITRGCDYNKDEPDLQVQKVFRRGRIKLKDAYDNMTKGYPSNKELYDYDSATNNCQRFVNTFLKQNQRAFHYGKKEKDFVVQEIDPLLKKYSKLQKASKAITDLAQRLSLFITGGATEEQDGGMIDQPEDALTNTEIENIMGRYKNFLGVSPVDTGYKLLHMVKAKQNGGMIYNLDKEGERGSHWVALYWDAKGNKPSICYYDSFGRDIPSDIQRDIKQIVKLLDCDKHMKLKINRKVNQDKKSVSCGYLCCLFLMDMFRGKSFKSATGFSINKNEDRAEELQEKFDYIIN